MPFHHPSGRNVAAGDDVSPSDVVQAGHRGDLDTVLGSIEHTDPAIRAVAISALLRLEHLDVDGWHRFAADPDPGVRRRAAELAARLPGALETENSLVALLSDTDEIVEMAAFALGEIGSMSDDRLTSATIERLEDVVRGHDDALCREAAVAALGALESGLDTILHACQDKATVRRRAIIALAPFEGPRVTEALQRALDDRDWQVRQAAEDLLAIDGAGSIDVDDSREPDGN